jgi:predicted Fe-Mo cluster-binding NifX family protein
MTSVTMHQDNEATMHEECADGGNRDCDQRGTSDCRREGGRGRGGGNCRREHGGGHGGGGCESTSDAAPSGTATATLAPMPRAGTMQVAVCASGPSLTDRVHDRFGRAEYFQLIDASTMTTRVIANDGNRAGTEGAGIGAVELIAEQGAHAAIVTKVGPKAADAFQRAGIAVYEAAGMTVGDAMVAFVRGELTCLDTK